MARPTTPPPSTADLADTPRRHPRQTPTTATAETFACDARGEPDSAACSAPAPEKPRVDRTERTGHAGSRNGTAIDHIVIHYTTSRNIEGSIAHFKSGTPRTSAHYIIGQDGLLVQMVPDRDSAWHAGSSAMNLRSIGIEHVARAGDRITEAQARTSVALIRWLMHAYAIPLAHVIPHVCIKSTSCCGDLFKEFGGGAGLPCAAQKDALHKWLALHGVTGTEMLVAAPGPLVAPVVEPVLAPVAAVAASPVAPAAAAATASAPPAPEAATPPRHWLTALPEAAPKASRMTMARAIVDLEARRDRQGRLAVYRLPPGDGGGRYEVAGINERYHKQACDELVALIEGGRHAEAETRAAEIVAVYTDQAAAWTHNPGVEFFLRDCIFNRGPGGAAWILQNAVGVRTDMNVGPVTLAAAQAAEAEPQRLLDRLRQSREAYERLRRNEASAFWSGLVNRWNKAYAGALDLQTIATRVASAAGVSPQPASPPAETVTAPAR